MNTEISKRVGHCALVLGLCAALLPALWPYSQGPDPFKTGGPFPGESSCAESGCHSSPSRLNKGPGMVSISVNPYKPGETQTITVTVSDPTEQRWGFQLTARPANSLMTSAGSFQPLDGNVQVVCGGPSFGPVPCGAGTISFAEHTLPGTRLGTRGGVTFQVNWTAPSSDVGDIIFAAAGNAANGNSQADPGDNIYTTSVTVSAAGSGAGPPPEISSGGIVGAGLSNPPVAQISPNGLISIFGQNFAAPGVLRGVTAGDLVDGHLPSNLAGVCVQIDSRPAPMFFVSPTQINAQAPSLSSTGAVGVQVIQNCGASRQVISNTQTVVMQPVAPEFFFFVHNSGGPSPVAATNAITGSLIGAPGLLPGAVFAPAKPGDFVALYGTGFGATNPSFAAGVLPDAIGATVSKVTVTLNNVVLADSDVLYAGVAPGFAGLYQLNLHIPANMPDGDLPISASINGVSTPPGAFITVQR